MTQKNEPAGKKRASRTANTSTLDMGKPHAPSHQANAQDRPLVVQDKNGQILLLLKIDSVIISVNSVQVSGWSHGDLKLDIQVANARPNWRIEREARPDVAKALGATDPDFVAGFSMRGQIAPGIELPAITMNWQTGSHSGHCNLAITNTRPDGMLEYVGNDLLVSGWALIRGMSKPPIVELFIAGKKVSEGPVSVVRPDLISAGFTREKTGFKLAIPPAALTHLQSEVEARVCGQRIAGSPLKLNLAPGVTASIAGISGDKLDLEINGWPGEFGSGHIKVDGVDCAPIPFDSGSMKRSGMQTRVSCPLPIALNDGQLHAYSAEIIFPDAVIGTDTHLLRNPDYGVCIDGANMDSMHGWVFRRNYNNPVQLGIYCEDKLIARGYPTRGRADVQAVHQLATPSVGFHLDLNAAPRKDLAEYELRDLDTGVAIAQVCVAYNFNALSNAVATLAQGPSDSRIALRALLSKTLAATQDEISFSWQPLPIRGPASQAQGIDVVIPIFGGASATAECIESVLAAQNRTSARFILVNDCSPDPIIVKYLQTLDSLNTGNLVIIHQRKNAGFSHSVNIGMVMAGRRDVILLNADTVVQDGWIDKLVAVANHDSRIATVTPLSNNGEIVTVPYMCKSLPVDDPQWATAVDIAATHVNSGTAVDIPVAVGFCMLIRRACIDEIGLFDAATWGRGYGEEVDFCIKATSLGWRHVAATDTFVVHRGNVSFGAEKLERVLESSKKISAKYPFYDSLIQRFLATDPIGPARRNVNIELIRQSLSARRVLHVSHAFGGGTEQYVKDVGTLYEGEGVASIFLRFAVDGSAEMEFHVVDKRLLGFFQPIHFEKYQKSERNTLQTDIARLNFERVHIHAVFGISAETLDWITKHFEFDLTVHDYAWICPRVTLTYPGGVYCNEPPVVQCSQCIARYGAHPGLDDRVVEFNGSVDAYRQYFSALFDRASNVYAGSSDVAKRLHAHGISKRIKAVAHPTPIGSPFLVTSEAQSARAAKGGSARVAIFGAISDIKGFSLLKSCVETALHRKLPIEFFVFGYTMDDAQFSSLPNIQILGKYEDEDLDRLVGDIQPHVSFFLHQWPETYSYTLSHSQRLGIWPISLDIGAPAERIRKSGYGTIIPYVGRTTGDLTDLLLTSALQVHPPFVAPLLEKSATSLANYRKAKPV